MFFGHLHIESLLPQLYAGLEGDKDAEDTQQGQSTQAEP